MYALHLNTTRASSGLWCSTAHEVVNNVHARVIRHPIHYFEHDRQKTTPRTNWTTCQQVAVWHATISLLLPLHKEMNFLVSKEEKIPCWRSCWTSNSLRNLTIVTSIPRVNAFKVMLSWLSTFLPPALLNLREYVKYIQIYYIYISMLIMQITTWFFCSSIRSMFVLRIIYFIPKSFMTIYCIEELWLTSFYFIGFFKIVKIILAEYVIHLKLK